VNKGECNTNLPLLLSKHRSVDGRWSMVDPLMIELLNSPALITFTDDVTLIHRCSYLDMMGYFLSSWF